MFLSRGEPKKYENFIDLAKEYSCAYKNNLETSDKEQHQEIFKKIESQANNLAKKFDEVTQLKTSQILNRRSIV